MSRLPLYSTCATVVDIRLVVMEVVLVLSYEMRLDMYEESER